MRHVLCAYLRHWPIDRLRRRRRELWDKPLVLVETTGNRQTVVHVSPETPPAVYPGMALVEARARHAGLLDLPAAPAADLRSLEALGHWLMRFSPSVCVRPPSTLFLDATGLERLYGGLSNLRRRVAGALASLRIAAAVTVAPTPGAAWALAAFGNDGPHVVTNEQVLPALSPLPPEALRLDDDTANVLSALGVRTIGSLLQLPRADLAVRFGPKVLTRIDQATGAVHEPLDYLPHRLPVRAALEFEGAVESLDAVGIAVRELTGEVAAQLAHRGLGARELRLTFRQPYGPPVERIVRLARPCRNAAALFKLLCCATENLEAAEGFIAVSLAANAVERLGDQQAALIGGEEERDAAELNHLVERLRARLDQGAEGTVEWGRLVESNLPEHASRCQDSAGDAPKLPGKARKPMVGQALLPVDSSLLGGMSTSRAHRLAADTNVCPTGRQECLPHQLTAGARGAVDLLRPLRLLSQPRSLRVMVRPSQSRDGQPVSFTVDRQVHRLDHVHGPERITGQWWNGRWKTRDYFDVLDAEGRRYWIFRVAQTGRWFLHGIFE